MTNSSSQEASKIIVNHWHQGTTLDNLPEAVRPTNTIEGYAIQRHIEQISKEPVFGWKIAATSEAGQQHINVTRPLAGRILAERVSKLGESVPLGPNRMMVAELEFVFRMGKTLSPRSDPYSMDDVMDAVDGLFLGVELPDSRFAEFTKVGAAQLIADNACADRWVLGPEVKVDWRTRDLSKHVVKGWTSDGTERVGSGAAVLGDPRIALTWIANELSEHDIELGQGQYITTGTCMIPFPVKPGVTIYGDYEDFGNVEVRFVE